MEFSQDYIDITDESTDEVREKDNQLYLETIFIQFRYARKVPQDIQAVEIFKQPRADKKLLVLDIDRTIYYVEKKQWSARPYLHEFLTHVHEFYDIVIWSATSMVYLVDKMKNMQLHQNERFNILFYLDINAMCKTMIPKKGKEKPALIKPLHHVYQINPAHHSSKNTIIVDDCVENFAFNAANGLLIEPFEGDPDDCELHFLDMYLVGLAKGSNDFTEVDHSLWTKYFLKSFKKD